MRARITGISAIAAGSLLVPTMVLAQSVATYTQQGGLIGLLALATRVLNAFVALFVLAAVVVFFWGLIKYLINVGEAKSEGLQTMIWGIIAIFVMVSIWGLIRILQATVGVDSNQSALTPQGIQPRI